MTDSYNPSDIFKKKRSLKARDPISLNAENPKAKANSRDDPVYAAKDYLEALMDAVTQLGDKINDLVNDCAMALKDGTTDDQLRDLNRDFQNRKKDIDNFVKQNTVKGDAPLSGKYSQKAKVFVLGEGISPIEIKIDPCDSKSLGLEHLRIDSFSYAKKTRQDIERAKETAKALQRMLGPKLETANGRVSAIALETVVEPKITNVRDNHIDLKISQERAARAKGRTYGLLINIKV